ncbi:hypothetical protein SD70_10870 [Gordoniibacillus kamchatkensis]|uniref:Glycoside hydrolase 123 catalytic domain-containing protein n=1 Tax=Gordoniibacillus kamchatkensis TaxID=1590651 RepID=A0ABR5AIR0_9BACL|nr:DUF4091 domain-containing protein [Paenibacillus sp. VKM B-2647]KIL40914.1 hypothetical protein SD70_10870 [Paenibacillus sp. VKM B-2647]
MSSGNYSFQTRCLSSLTKVFADEELQDLPYANASALQGETYSFQIAYRLGGPQTRTLKSIGVRIETDLPAALLIRSVGLAPSEFPCYGDHDGHVLRSTPGLYPDPLFPVHPNEGIAAVPGQWRSIWITAEIDSDAKAGNYPIRVIFESAEGERIGEEAFELDIVGARLPEQKLLHTEWLHTDCLATYYRVDIFSEAHWIWIERYMETASRHGINMILTPIFTPPLDTQVGGERPTVQLVDVVKDGDRYTFGFGRLKRWVDLCERHGIRFLEFSHLFTQWGAAHAPKIMASENGQYKQIFGWETDASGRQYAAFLDQFLPSLLQFIREHGLEAHSYFHVSDEPGLNHLPTYRSASQIVAKHLADYPVIDALSNYEFYEQGLVRNPIPASNHIREFQENGIPNLWTYYCCSQYKQVSNRFFNMPSVRNRVIGMQLYKGNIAGFLHWGYNFWYSQYSKYPIDPYRVTDAGLAFPSGDAFVVYPGEDGPIESIRLEVFFEALQDLRALQLLESMIGRERVLQLVEEGLPEGLDFDVCPTDTAWLLSRREAVNRAIREGLKTEGR